MERCDKNANRGGCNNSASVRSYGSGDDCESLALAATAAVPATLANEVGSGCSNGPGNIAKQSCHDRNANQGRCNNSTSVGWLLRGSKSHGRPIQSDYTTAIAALDAKDTTPPPPHLSSHNQPNLSRASKTSRTLFPSHPGNFTIFPTGPTLHAQAQQLKTANVAVLAQQQSLCPHQFDLALLDVRRAVMPDDSN
ncbi:hypothetical protein ACA910_006076 [Epithemia clementina (nom. ined.)]